MDGDYKLDLTSQLIEDNESSQVHEIWIKIHGCKVVMYNRKTLYINERAWTRPSKEDCGDLAMSYYNLQHHEWALK